MYIFSLDSRHCTSYHLSRIREGWALASIDPHFLLLPVIDSHDPAAGVTGRNHSGVRPDAVLLI